MALIIIAETGLGKSTCQRYIQKFEEGGLAAVKDRRSDNGAARKTTQEEDRRIVATMRAHNFDSAAHIKARLGLQICDKVIRQRGKEAGLKSYVAAKTVALTEQHRERRVAFARECLAMPVQEWETVIFTDEKVFSSDKDGRYRVYREAGQRYNPQNTKKNESSGRVTTAFHGWMAGGGVGALTPTTRGMNSVEYLDILQNAVIPAVRAVYPVEEVPILRIVEDNSAVHRARIVQEWYDAQPDVLRFNWPSKSPDLNPIENAWSEVVRGFRPVHGETVEQLRARVLAVWESMRQRPEYTEALIASMPRRMHKVIEANGHPINY